ncbi:MAG: ATP-binding domain-containing protein, partial [Cyanobacteria bacterium REEB65]|nr:ATP-binding domain-containing protein [Cyanobacteria bacterium REEB65]
NPAREGQVRAPGSAGLRQGDRVIQLKNNYQLDVFNGDVGIVHEVNPEDQRLIVAYPERSVEYDFSDLDELSLAYALSIHKAQGSEYPVVIVPMTTQHFPMLQRNLLYTAITRARRLLVLVGTHKAVAIAVKNDRMIQRHSRLAERLRGEIL